MYADCLPQDSANNLLKCANIWQSSLLLQLTLQGIIFTDHLRCKSAKTFKTVVVFLSFSDAFKVFSMDSAVKNIIYHLCVVVWKALVVLHSSL